jgi:hypothetical protein
MLNFEHACVKAAWGHWTKVWAWPRTLYTTLASIVAPTLVWLRGVNTARDWVWAAVALLLFPAAVFAFHLAMAPRRLWTDQQKTITDLTTQLAERQTAKDLAEQLEQAHEKGLKLLRSGESNDFPIPTATWEKWSSEHADWYSATLALVSQINDSERFMFKSIAPAPERYTGTEKVSFRDHSRRELGHHKARLEKLRLITDRRHQRSERSL